MPAIVEGWSEGHAFLIRLFQKIRVQHLKAPAIRKNCPIPTHELVKPPSFIYQVYSWSQIKDKCVWYYCFKTKVAYLIEFQSFYCALCCNGHEKWCFNISMGCVQPSNSGSSIILMQYLKHQFTSEWTWHRRSCRNDSHWRLRDCKPQVSFSSQRVHKPGAIDSI